MTIAEDFIRVPELFPWSHIDPEHVSIAKRYLGPQGLWRKPDLVIVYEDGAPYLFRWHVIERNYEANTYFHIQTASDPERPLHTHPWDNQSVILAGDGYDELVQNHPPLGQIFRERRNVGDVITRRAKLAHRLVMPFDAKYGYTMTQFTTGPAIDKWGFWIGTEFYPHDQIVKTDEHGRSFFHWPEGTNKDDYRDTH